MTVIIVLSDGPAVPSIESPHATEITQALFHTQALDPSDTKPSRSDRSPLCEKNIGNRENVMDGVWRDITHRKKVFTVHNSKNR